MMKERTDVPLLLTSNPVSRECDRVVVLGRGERIRTSDHRYPIPVRYRTAPRPEKSAIAAQSI
jgi:hypothetical protein